MTRFNVILATLAASGLAFAHPAAAATTDGEGGWFEDAPGAAPVVGLIAAVGLVFLIMAISDGDDDDDEDNFPVSP